MNKEEKLNLPDNDIPDEVIHRAEMMAKAMFKTKPISDRKNK